MVEDVVIPRRAAVAPAPGLGPQKLSEIEVGTEDRLRLDNLEFERVLGGGVVPGSLVLIGGDPGIGKSTLLLQMSVDVAATVPVLYISGEESVAQIKTRALRVSNGARPAEHLYLAAETDVDRVVGQIEALAPKLAIIDSIQTVHSADITSAAGSISQVRECASRLQAVAKSSGVAIFLAGHVTKDGAIAGPRVLEHLVDTVLYLEGDPYHSYRLLRTVKNRYGATTEVGVFKMGAFGLEEVANPSEAFLAERLKGAPGSAIAVTMEGSRPLLVEVQGLTSPTTFGHPRRTANGVDTNRLLIITAVLTRRVGLQLSDQDIFINVVGGLQVREPAADLALAAAIASSARDRALPPDLALIGEVGLSGELRRVPRLEARLREAVKLGFSSIVVPKGADPGWDLPSKAKLHEMAGLSEALEFALQA